MKIKILLAALVMFTSANASAAPILGFIIDGNTFTQDFSIVNNSSDGEQVTGFELDLRGTGLCFDLEFANDIGDICNPGNPSASFANTSPASSAVALLSSSIVDANGGNVTFDFLSLAFNNFNPGSVFTWSVDVDPFNGGSNGGVNGDDLIGAKIAVTFSNGQVASGVLEAVSGNFDASQFVVESIKDVSAPAVGILFLASLLVFGASRKRHSKK